MGTIKHVITVSPHLPTLLPPLFHVSSSSPVLPHLNQLDPYSFKSTYDFV